MNIRTRHMAILSYAGLSALIIAKGLITDPTQILLLIAPLIGMFTWDKLKGTK